MPAPYGAIEPVSGARRPEEGGAQQRRPVLALAALSLLCVASTVWLGARGSRAGVELVSMGSLGQDERDMDGVESDIQSELNKNNLLSQKFSNTFGGGADIPKASTQGASKNCKCDCSTQPQLADAV